MASSSQESTNGAGRLFRSFDYFNIENFEERFDEWIANVREYIDTDRELREKYQDFLRDVKVCLTISSFKRNSQLKKNITKVHDTLKEVLGESFRRVHFRWGRNQQVDDILIRMAAEYRAKHGEEE